MNWKVGDRVSVDPTARGDWTSGTVTAVDEEGATAWRAGPSRPDGERRRRLLRLAQRTEGASSGLCCILKDQAGI